MKGLTLTVLLLLFIPQKGFSQVDEKDLIGIWFPVLEQSAEGDTTSFLSHALVYSFNNVSNGFIEDPGLNVETIPFTYHIISDSIFFQFNEGKPKDRRPKNRTARILEVDKNHLQISFDSNQIVSFILLPEYKVKKSVLNIKTGLYNEVWEFEMNFEGYGEPYKVLYQFEDKTDSSLIREDYRNSIHLVETHQKFLHKTDPIFWSVGKHDGTMIIRVNDLWSGFQSFIYIIKEISRNKMKLMVWSRGVAYPVTAKRKSAISTKTFNKILSKLTGTKWQFHSEKIPQPIDTTGLIILDMVLDDFEELPPYKRDSTAIISQKDLDEKLLILEFQPDGRYYIYRKERVLDSGNWTPMFNLTQLKLKSSRKRDWGDGIYGGVIEIESLKKGEFILRRRFEQQSNISGRTDESYLETYKPYKKGTS